VRKKRDFYYETRNEDSYIGAVCACALTSAEKLVQRYTVAPVSSIIPVISQVLLLQQHYYMHMRSVMYMCYVYAANILSNDVRCCECWLYANCPPFGERGN